MGGFFGAVCRRDAIADVFFGTDYHSHLGTRRGGMAELAALLRRAERENKWVIHYGI